MDTAGVSSPGRPNSQATTASGTNPFE